MNHGFGLENAVRTRYSVRTYEKKPVPPAVREDLMAYASAIRNPLGPEMRVQFVEKTLDARGEKLGTYGMIRGADLFLGVTIPDLPHAPEALGYAFEQLVLYAASRGLGTCWLGGTFNRSGFAAAMDIREGEVFPILSPVGYPAEKLRLTERFFRKAIQADDRQPWQTRFFREDPDHPLTPETAGEYRFPLEMVRLAPSAVNKQPWRVVVTEHGVHFYQKTAGGEMGPMDMGRIDLGIAMCHFDLAVREQGMEGTFLREDPGLTAAKDLRYIATWKRA